MVLRNRRTAGAAAAGDAKDGLSTSPDEFRADCHCGKCAVTLSGLPDWVINCHSKVVCLLLHLNTCNCKSTEMFQPDSSIQASRTVHSAQFVTLCGYVNPASLSISRGSKILTTYLTKDGETFYKCPSCVTTLYRTSPNYSSTGSLVLVVPLCTLVAPNHGTDGTLDQRFRPTCHVHYAQGLLSSFDYLPKFKSLPPSMGGDGAKMDEVGVSRPSPSPTPNANPNPTHTPTTNHNPNPNLSPNPNSGLWLCLLSQPPHGQGRIRGEHISTQTCLTASVSITVTVIVT